MARNLLRQISLITYRLKREYGLPAALCRVVSNENNLHTGEVTRIYGVLPIRRAILLPDRESLSSYYTGPFYQAGRAFTYGAEFEENTRPCIIDMKDLRKNNKTNSIAITDYILIRGTKYNIRRSVLSEDLAAYMLQLSHVGPEGLPPGILPIPGPTPDDPDPRYLQRSFETIAQNVESLGVIDTDYIEKVHLIKTFDAGWGRVIVVSTFFDPITGLPTTKTLSGDGLPPNIATVCTYDFTGRTVPLKTYTEV